MTPRYSQKNVFKYGIRPTCWICKISIFFVKCPCWEWKSASVCQIWSKLDNSALRFEDKFIFKMAAVRHLEFSKIADLVQWPTCISAVRSVTLNLANKFSQCNFSVTEHYDLFGGLIILQQAWWRRSYDVIPHRPHRTDKKTAAGKAQRYHTDLKLIYMLPIVHYTTRRQFRVHGHFKSVRNNRRHIYKTATPTR